MTDNFAKEMLEVSKMKVGLLNTGKFTRPPQPVGYWVLGKGGDAQVNFPMYVKPTPEQIENHKTMLGWDWVEVQA
jgi:hypothetical protein